MIQITTVGKLREFLADFDDDVGILGEVVGSDGTCCSVYLDILKLSESYLGVSATHPKLTALVVADG